MKTTNTVCALAAISLLGCAIMKEKKPEQQLIIIQADQRCEEGFSSLGGFLFHNYYAAAGKMKEMLEERKSLSPQGYGNIEAMISQATDFLEVQAQYCNRVAPDLFLKNADKGYISISDPRMILQEGMLFIGTCDPRKFKMMYGRIEEVERLLEEHYKKNQKEEPTGSSGPEG